MRMRTGCITEHVPSVAVTAGDFFGFCRPVSGTAAACGTACSPGTLGGTCQRLAPPESFGKCTRMLRCSGRGSWRLGGGPGKWVPGYYLPFFGGSLCALLCAPIIVPGCMRAHCTPHHHDT